MKKVRSWYKESFGYDYLTIYKHRDFQGAAREVQRMIEWLQLPTGAHILDLCCGMGRHSLALADFGYQVTGVDLSEVLLQEARDADINAKVTWIHGDMRHVPTDQQFDAIVNLFTSFGYFDQDEENQLVIDEMARLLKPGGKYIIDYLNPEYVKAHLVPYSERTEEKMTIEERRSVEDGFVRKRITIRENGQKERNYLEQVRLFSLQQFERMLKHSHLQLDQVYGSYDGELYEPGSSIRMIMVGCKH